MSFSLSHLFSTYYKLIIFIVFAEFMQALQLDAVLRLIVAVLFVNSPCAYVC